MGFEFKIIANDKKTKARAGILRTAHGEIETPVFIPVGTQGTVKSQTPNDLKTIGVQIFLANTYHLYLRPGVEVIEKLGGLHKFTRWDKPLMTDSGGFQVFSLAREKIQNSKLKTKNYKEDGTAPIVKIDDEGVTFRSHLDGSLHRFTPEISIEVQQKLGADIILAFDDCSPYPAKESEVKKAVGRTHAWALRSLKAAQGGLFTGDQAIFGIIQGGVFKDLREESAKFISSLALSGVEGFDGLAIGGVAVGESKKEMYQVLDWVMPYLPEGKPKHLLGVGEIDDLFAAVERGVDMFDCVMPTRLGRMGHILVRSQKSTFIPSSGRGKVKSRNFTMDITKAVFADDPKPPEEGCQCYTCQNFSRAYLNHLFRARELLAYRLATYHNLWFIVRLMGEIRKAIVDGHFLNLKRRWLSRK